STTLLREQSISVVLDRMLALTLDSFGFAAGAFYLRASPDEPFLRMAIAGYPRPQVEGLLYRPVGPGVMEGVLSPEFRVRETFYYVPGEHNRLAETPVALRRFPELADLARSETGAWQERDILAFPFFDRHGRIVGVLTPDDPIERRFPSDEVIRAIEMFAALASVAVENARLSTQRELSARQMAEVLRVSGSLLAEERLDDLLSAILRAAARTFELPAAEIALLDDERGVFVRRAALGRTLGEPIDAEVDATMVTRRLAPAHRRPEGYYAGFGLLTFPFPDAAGRIIGFLAPDLPQGVRPIAPESARLLQIFANFAGLAVARAAVRDLEGRRLRELEEIAQMKSDFVSTVSHELRTPLTSIKGFVSVLLHRRGAMNEERKIDALEIVDEEADRLIRLVDDLLAAARLERGKLRFDPRPTPVVEVIDRAVMGVAMEYPERRFIVRPPANGLCAQTDPDHCQRILTNLLTNAAKYSAEGEIAVELESTEERVLIDIVDRGPGIAPGDRDRVFERFVRLEDRVRSHPGTGLGLYISRELATAIGAELTIEDDPAAGCRIRLSLPRA
ncbi:MAG: hypothetical protein KGM44_14140, partial [bacterium]|nr:hypothetical protein [bacterium]